LLLTLAFAVSRPLFDANAIGSAQAKERPTPAKEKRETKKNTDAPAKPQPTEPNATPPALANSPAAAELARQIDRLIDESEFARARWGISVISMRDGRILYARNADAPITPASNMKVYTTAVALDLLGPDYRWQTSVYAATQPDASGTIDGDLILYGRGAPDFSSERTKDGPGAMSQLADELYRRGVRRVRGRLIGDESYFRGDPLGDGWLWNDVQWYFGAEVSALTVNDNEVIVNIKPPGKPKAQAAIKVEPDTDYIHIHDETNVVESDAPATLGITRGLSDNEVRVWGDFPAGSRGLSARLSIHQPALWAATLFRRILTQRGINVEGETQARDARSHAADPFDPARALELANVNSKSLGEIARATNKESINLNAELILRTLGKERGPFVPEFDQKRMRERNDDQAGLAVVRQWLEQAGIKTANLALHDGSGLSRLDLITPEATARLLINIARRPVAELFRDSLPVAGRDGTLKSRLRSSAGRILAKTGTLTYINSLSGYAATADDEPLAFSIICNNETAEARGTLPIDAIASLLAAYSESPER
ncbi:MAG TPA: D-alanyl-D-alanine carboxypeptidase/D-alanyl-D-alanine-endopeptidase, partial [Pyrinomonadaceae bacterium]